MLRVTSTILELGRPSSLTSLRTSSPPGLPLLLLPARLGCSLALRSTSAENRAELLLEDDSLERSKGEDVAEDAGGAGAGAGAGAVRPRPKTRQSSSVVERVISVGFAVGFAEWAMMVKTSKSRGRRRLVLFLLLFLGQQSASADEAEEEKDDKKGYTSKGEHW